MSATTHPTALFSGLTSRAVSGALAGIAGGIVYGMLLVMMGMLPVIATLVGSESAIVGALVHLVISAGVGALFGVVVPATRLGVLLGAGAVYGLVWWVLGPQVILPLWLGRPPFTTDAGAWMILMGHIIYGLFTAAALFGIRRYARS
ncbi:MAG: hypothetical protein M3460_17185 [Actinomycetota bacterium]|nr:hypothetical protein [Actinomycetota bacterium]